MKRILVIFAAAALFCQAAALIAQEGGEPSLKSVLDAARAKYWHEKKADSAPETTDAPEAADPVEVSEATDQVPYTPFILSFVPGVSLPLGYYDASLVGGCVANLVRDVTGVEGAGVFNVARDIRGLQGAGVFNVSRSVFGFQGAGVFNIVDRDVVGFQGAGTFNLVRGSVTGIQGAGFFNVAGKVRAPLQAAGVFNIADEVHGCQAAGVFNIAGSVEGGQAAGVFNKADRVTGVQVGLVNVAGYIDGVQLGLVNIAGNGVDSLGLTYEPLTGFAYAHWQAGTPALYTVVGLGAPSGDWFRDFSGFVTDFGLGSRGKFLGFNIDFDLLAEEPVGVLHEVQSPNVNGTYRVEGWDQLKPYPSARLMVGLPLGKRFQIVGGLKADIDIASLGDRIPSALKVGDDWRGSLFGQDFSVWPKWFLGLKI